MLARVHNHINYHAADLESTEGKMLDEGYLPPDSSWLPSRVDRTAPRSTVGLSIIEDSRLLELPRVETSSASRIPDGRGRTY